MWKTIDARFSNRVNPDLYLVCLVVATMFIATQALAQGPVVTDGLVSYWTFDEADIQDKTAKDVFGKHDGTIVGAPKIIKGQVREALEFDGKGDYVDVTNLGNFGSQLATSTFEVWMRTALSKEWRTLFKVLDDGCNMGWAIEPNRSALAGFPYKKDFTHFYVRDAEKVGCVDIAAEVEFPLSDGNWHHIAFIVDNAEKNMLRIYIDGEAQEVILGRKNGPKQFANFVQPVFVGAGNNRGAPSRHFQGALDEVRIYKRPLTEKEVVRNFRSKIGLGVEAASKLPIVWGGLKINRHSLNDLKN